MDYLFFKICFFSACVGWCYVEKLTQEKQLFDFMIDVHRLMPNKINQALSCSYCFGGWVSIFSILANYDTFQNCILLSVLTAPMVTMFFVGLIHYFTPVYK